MSEDKQAKILWISKLRFIYQGYHLFFETFYQVFQIFSEFLMYTFLGLFLVWSQVLWKKLCKKVKKHWKDTVKLLKMCFLIKSLFDDDKRILFIKQIFLSNWKFFEVFSKFLKFQFIFLKLSNFRFPCKVAALTHKTKENIS